MALLGALLIGVCGCQVTPPEQKIEDAVHAREDVAVTQQQVRLRMRALVEPMSGAIIESADRIMAGTTNGVVRREALIWKIEAVPALREALFRPNPFVATMDSWVLLWQMRDYFETGPGQKVLGAAASIAVKTCQELAKEIETITASMMTSGDVSDVREFARKWAREHPIEYSIAGRESTLSRVTERQIQETFTTQELAGHAMVTLDDLARRMDVYSAQLMEQARWQAELFAMDMAVGYRLEEVLPLAQAAGETMAAARELGPDLAETLAVARTTPEVVSRERAAATQAAHEEISRTLEFIKTERVAALQDVSRERETAIKELHRAIAEERQLLARDVEQIGLKVADHTIVQFTRQVWVLLIAVFVGMIVLLFIARGLFSRR